MHAFSPTPKSASERRSLAELPSYGAAPSFFGLSNGSGGLCTQPLKEAAGGYAHPPRPASRGQDVAGKPFALVSGHKAAMLRRTIWERWVVERWFRAFPTSSPSAAKSRGTTLWWRRSRKTSTPTLVQSVS